MDVDAMQEAATARLKAHEQAELEAKRRQEEEAAAEAMRRGNTLGLLRAPSRKVKRPVEPLAPPPPKPSSEGLSGEDLYSNLVEFAQNNLLGRICNTHRYVGAGHCFDLASKAPKDMPLCANLYQCVPMSGSVHWSPCLP